MGFLFPLTVLHHQVCGTASAVYVVEFPYLLQRIQRISSKHLLKSQCSSYSTESSAVYQCKVSPDKAQHPRPKDKKLVASLQIIEVFKLHGHRFSSVSN